MTRESPPWREPLHEAIAAVLGEHAPATGAVLTGWVVVAETVDPDGRRWLHRMDGPDTITVWAREGMLHNALNTEWSPDTDDD